MSDRPSRRPVFKQFNFFFHGVDKCLSVARCTDLAIFQAGNINVDGIYDNWICSPMSARERFEIYPSIDLLKAVDRWRARQDEALSRAQAARRLLERILAAEGDWSAAPATKRQSQMTDGT